MGQTVSRSSSSPTAAASASSCPIQTSSPPSSCPVSHQTPSPAASSSTPAQCPVSHSDGVNPLNQMPNLSQSPSASQTSDLPTERTISSIPRDESTHWEYPSPQQFHNALARKGMETPEEHVEEMVQIHNFLNERAWLEVLRWEMLAQGTSQAEQQRRLPEVQLARFRGRPGELSPKARFWLLAGWLLPTRFNTEPPFDRHDWVVRRPATGKEVRYVIDYYSAPPLPDGSPVFSLDVRPALDSFESIKQRIQVATKETWAAWGQSGPEVGAA